MITLRTILAIASLIFYTNYSWAQDGKYIIEEDSSFQLLLNEKRRNNTASTADDRFKIQIFYGNNAEAKRTLMEFKQKYENIDGTIVYTNPLYKVWVGNFKTRLEATKNLKEIKKSFPNALLIRPGK